MDSPRNRLMLGIAAVALVLGLCVAAVWSVRGRLPAQNSVAVSGAVSADDQALRAENVRLRSEVQRLSAERDAALARSHPVPAQATPVPEPPVEQAVQAPPQVQQRRPKPAPAATGDFSEPQTFSSASTSN